MQSRGAQGGSPLVQGRGQGLQQAAVGRAMSSWGGTDVLRLRVAAPAGRHWQRCCRRGWRRGRGRRPCVWLRRRCASRCATSMPAACGCARTVGGCPQGRQGWATDHTQSRALCLSASPFAALRSGLSTPLPGLLLCACRQRMHSHSDCSVQILSPQPHHLPAPTALAASPTRTHTHIHTSARARTHTQYARTPLAAPWPLLNTPLGHAVVREGARGLDVAHHMLACQARNVRLFGRRRRAWRAWAAQQPPQYRFVGGWARSEWCRGWWGGEQQGH